MNQRRLSIEAYQLWSFIILFPSPCSTSLEFIALRPDHQLHTHLLYPMCSRFANLYPMYSKGILLQRLVTLLWLLTALDVFYPQHIELSFQSLSYHYYYVFVWFLI